jgi:hypothetical protein
VRKNVKEPSQITLPEDWQREILRRAVAFAPAAQDDGTRELTVYVNEAP